MWTHVKREAFYNTRRGDAMAYTERIEASTGVIGGELSVPRALSPYVHEVSYGPTDGRRADPFAQLALGPAGQPYIAARLGRRRKLQIAAVHPDLSLGASRVIARAIDRRPPLAISESGRGIALIPVNDSGSRDFKIVRFWVPAP